jgi:uncharacterized flavoprotein (TIGR03862 family)
LLSFEVMQKKIAIIGGGPAAMILATKLNTDKFQVTLYEKMPTIGRKFLVAGKGGFNLTHSEDQELMIERYLPKSLFKRLFQHFDNNDLREWLASLGIETFVGSSKRVFPIKGTKPIDVLTAIKKEILKNKVVIKTNHEWLGWNDQNHLLFKTKNGLISIKSELVIFALGGASWAKTGSDGFWTKLLQEKGIKTKPFQASNCAYEINWKDDFIKKSEGTPLKNISIRCGDKTKKGEVVITKFGLEGGAIYALSPEIRTQLNAKKEAEIFIDLKPTLSVLEICKRLNKSRSSKSWTQHIETRLKFNKTSIALIKNYISKDDFKIVEKLAFQIKNLSFKIEDFAPIDDAISTVGGIDLDEIDKDFQLKKLSNHFAIGEMLDWDAPTGGYLLQACFSMGKSLADHLNNL